MTDYLYDPTWGKPDREPSEAAIARLTRERDEWERLCKSEREDRKFQHSRAEAAEQALATAREERDCAWERLKSWKARAASATAGRKGDA